MSEVSIELPVRVNRVYITKEIINTLDFVQAGGTSGWNTPNYDNSGVLELQGHINDVAKYILEKTCDERLTEDHLKELDLLIKLHWVSKVIEALAAPNDIAPDHSC